MGQVLRARYGEYLNSTYSIEEIYVQSSDRDRTIQTALSALAGLFPTNEGLSPDLNWLPIPVFTIPEELDNVCYI